MRALLLVVVLVLAGCAQPEVTPTPQLDPELGVGPTVSVEEPAPLVSPSSVDEVSPGQPTASPVTREPATSRPAVAPSPSSASETGKEATPESTGSAESSPASDPSPPSPTDAPVPLLSVADTAGDHGEQGPDWADLASAEMTEIANDLRVTLRYHGELPATPPKGEVPLVGVDIGDEGYQLFVEGGGESWTAYLDTPEGFVEYPGTFRLAGSALVLQVPFSAVGSPTRAPVRVFAEWSRDSGTLGVLNPTSEDTLDGEPHTFDRAS